MPPTSFENCALACSDIAESTQVSSFLGSIGETFAFLDLARVFFFGVVLDSIGEALPFLDLT